MTLKTGPASIGGFVSAVGGAATYFALGASWSVLSLVAGISGALALVSYIVAAVAVETSFGEFMRGWLIGLNAALNITFGFVLGSMFAGTPGGLIAALALGLINLLSVFAGVSQSDFFQGVIGWLNWLMPMSWPIVALGFLCYVFSFVLYAVTAGRVEFLHVQDLGADWRTGTFFMKGGFVANLNYLHTAFNMGNFSFVDYT